MPAHKPKEERPETPPLPNGRIKAVLVAAAGVTATLVMGTPEGQRALLAFSVFGVLLFLLLRAPGAGVPATLLYLTFLGGVRRGLIPVFGWAAADPLLLVGPAVAGVYYAGLLITRRLPRDTPLARLVLGLFVLMVLQMANPLQGGVAVGLAGALFYIVPLLWFYYGRDAGAPATVTQAFRAVVAVACLAALYGLSQTWFGFSAAEEEWVRLSGYEALMVGGTTRAFSFFTSAAEYAYFLAFAIVLLWAAWLRGGRAALLPVPLLAVAIFLESSRTIVVVTLVTCAALWAVQGRDVRGWLPRGLVALVVALVGLVWSLNQVQRAEFSGKTRDLVEHQAGGLLHPMDGKRSTAASHGAMFLNGLAAGFSEPLGRGLGATTLAAAKFGGQGGSTEVDLSNLFVSLGAFGGLVYAAIYVLVLQAAVRYWHRARSHAALGILAVLLLSLGHWLNGQHYAGSMLTWFCVGALDRARQRA